MSFFKIFLVVHEGETPINVDRSKRFDHDSFSPGKCPKFGWVPTERHPTRSITIMEKDIVVESHVTPNIGIGDNSFILSRVVPLDSVRTWSPWTHRLR